MDGPSGCSRKGKAREVLEPQQARCKGREEARGLVSQVSRDQRGPGQVPGCTGTVTGWAASRISVSWPPPDGSGFQQSVGFLLCPGGPDKLAEGCERRVRDVAAGGG